MTRACLLAVLCVLWGCDALAQTPPALDPQLGATPINDPLTQLIVQLLSAGGIPAVLLGLLGYLIRGGGPTLNIRSAEPAVVKLDAPLTVQFSSEDRELMRAVARQAENQAKLDERSREQRREVRRIRDVLHMHGNVLQILANKNDIDLNGVSARHGRGASRDEDDDSDEPAT